jgi:hypothetical protein
LTGTKSDKLTQLSLAVILSVLEEENFVGIDPRESVKISGELWKDWQALTGVKIRRWRCALQRVRIRRERFGIQVIHIIDEKKGVQTNNSKAKKRGWNNGNGDFKGEVGGRGEINLRVWTMGQLVPSETSIIGESIFEWFSWLFEEAHGNIENSIIGASHSDRPRLLDTLCTRTRKLSGHRG